MGVFGGELEGDNLVRGVGFNMLLAELFGSEGELLLLADFKS